MLYHHHLLRHPVASALMPTNGSQIATVTSLVTVEKMTGRLLMLLMLMLMLMLWLGMGMEEGTLRTKHDE
jgi:hypothetical protein